MTIITLPQNIQLVDSPPALATDIGFSTVGFQFDYQ